MDTGAAGVQSTIAVKLFRGDAVVKDNWMTLPTKSKCMVVTRIVGGEGRREGEEESVKEGDERRAVGGEGEKEGFVLGDWRVFLPARYPTHTVPYGRATPACSGRTGGLID